MLIKTQSSTLCTQIEKTYLDRQRNYLSEIPVILHVKPCHWMPSSRHFKGS